MDELSRANQISRMADDIIKDPGNAQKCLARAHAIKGLAEGIDEVEHEKVRKMISISTFAEEKQAVAEDKQAPTPENKQAKKGK